MVVFSRICTSLVLFGSNFAVTDNEEMLKDVERRIVTLAAKHTSMIADVVMHAAWDEVDIKVEESRTGTYESQREKNFVRVRQELKVKGVETVGEDQTSFQQTELTVSNGRIVHKMTDQDGIKSVVITPVDPRFTGRIDENMFKRWHREYDLTLMPSVSVAGRNAWVIDAKAKKQDDAGTWHDRFYFDKEFGIMIRRESLNDKGEPIQSHEYRNVRIDVEMDPARFEFTPPEDANVIDHTGRKRGGIRK